MSDLKTGDLVLVKIYFRNSIMPIAGGIHARVVEVKQTIPGYGHVRTIPLVEVLTEDGIFNHYTANNLKLLEGS